MFIFSLILHTRSIEETIITLHYFVYYLEKSKLNPKQIE